MFPKSLVPPYEHIGRNAVLFQLVSSAYRLVEEAMVQFSSACSRILELAAVALIQIGEVTLDRDRPSGSEELFHFARTILE